MAEEGKMKDSGIEWIGEMPDSWDLKRGKFILKQIKRPIREDDDIVTCFRDGEVTLRKNRRTEGFTLADKENGYQGIEPGDLVVHGMDGFAGAIGISDSRGKSTPVYIVLETNQDKKYLMYYLRAMAYSDVFIGLSTGIRERSCELKYYKLADIKYPIPPLSEQRAISKHLDKILAKTDQAIALKNEQLEQLAAYKKSLISECVCRGVSEQTTQDVVMKDSDIEWIGNIPAHWDISKVKYHLKRMDPRNPGDQIVLSLYREWGIVPKDSRNDNHNVTSEDTSKYKYVRPGDFVVNKMKAWQGSVSVSNYEGIVSPAYYVYHFTDDKFEPRYFHYLLRGSYKSEFMRLSGGVRPGQWDLPSEALDNTLVVIPPINEQQQIIEYLDKQSSNIDLINEKLQQEITALEEYKKSVIYEYVTGKKRL